MSGLDDGLANAKRRFMKYDMRMRMYTRSKPTAAELGL